MINVPTSRNSINTATAVSRTLSMLLFEAVTTTIAFTPTRDREIFLLA